MGPLPVRLVLQEVYPANSLGMMCLIDICPALLLCSALCGKNTKMKC